MGARQNWGARDQMVEVRMSYKGADDIFLNASHPRASLIAYALMAERED